jgi:hypothetical protein
MHGYKGNHLIVTLQFGSGYPVWQWIILWLPGQNIRCLHSTVSSQQNTIFFSLSSLLCHCMSHIRKHFPGLHGSSVGSIFDCGSSGLGLMPGKVPFFNHDICNGFGTVECHFLCFCVYLYSFIFLIDIQEWKKCRCFLNVKKKFFLFASLWLSSQNTGDVWHFEVKGSPSIALELRFGSTFCQDWLATNWMYLYHFLCLRLP